MFSLSIIFYFLYFFIYLFSDLPQGWESYNNVDSEDGCVKWFIVYREVKNEDRTNL